MIRNLTLIALGALAIAACNKTDHDIVAGEKPDPMAAELNKAAPIELPPSIQASKSYRCKDNSLVYIDWMSDGSARVKAEKTEVGISVKPGEEGSPLTGASADASITYNGKSCKG